MMTTTQTNDLSYDPYDVEIDADPYPVFARLREEAPLYYNEQYDFYALSRYGDVERGLVDRDTYISGRGGILEIIKAGIEMPPGILIFEDPPTHTIHRGLLSRVFTPRQVNGLEPKIREFCARSLDPLVGEPGFDFIKDLGAQMPMRVIGMLLGIPEGDQEAVRDRVDATLRTEPGKPMRPTQEKFATGEGFEEYIDWRAAHPSDHPDQRRDLVEDRSLIPAAIEELLRFEPPAPHVGRYVARDTEHHGEKVPEGSAMLMLVGAANRDDRRFPDGDRFDIHRPAAQHLTFGYGAHFCLGAALARLEGRV